VTVENIPSAGEVTRVGSRDLAVDGDDIQDMSKRGNAELVFLKRAASPFRPMTVRATNPTVQNP
jgi:hypothetical protein